MRILCIADEYPWPATNGYRIRVSNVLRGLARAGTVDLFCTISERPDVPHGVVPAPSEVERLFVHHRRPFGPNARFLAAWLRSDLPRTVAWLDWNGPEAALAQWAQPRYDLVWFSHCHSWLGLGAVDRGPAIVDLDNLEDEKLRTLMRLWEIQRSERLSPLPLRRRLRRLVGSELDRIDVGRWERAQWRAARAARAVVVCSDLDRDRFGVGSAVVLPNGYELASGVPKASVAAPSTAPVLTMVGLLIYPPNLDGARFFARRVLPLVRRSIPAARFRLVGRHDGLVDDLRGLAGVEVLGEVEALDEVFASTTAVVVCLRAGSGTRVKVLEAFARGLPVVSTTLGCEGLDARDGRELLVADTPDDLAAACVRILSEPTLAASVAEEGHRLWEARYRWDDLRALVGRLALEVAAP